MNPSLQREIPIQEPVDSCDDDPEVPEEDQNNNNLLGPRGLQSVLLKNNDADPPTKMFSQIAVDASLRILRKKQKTNGPS